MVTATAGALLVGVVSAGSALLGATVSSSTAQNIAQEQSQSVLEQKAREQREVTYREYLDAANGYRIAAADLFAKTAPQDIEAAITSFMTTRARFQKQTNEVYVYGSDQAWRAHETVAETLPPALSDSPLDFNVSELSDEATFVAAYRGFLAVRCQEVAARARSGCAD